MIIIKFGGSAITDKAYECTYQPKIVNQLVGELVEFYDRGTKNIKHQGGARLPHDDFRIILIHGAGSFGHIKAKKFKLNEGYSNSTQLLALSKVHRDVRELDRLFMEDLLAQAFPVIALPPLAVVKNNNKKIESLDFQKFDEILELGNIPISYGDMVLDQTLKFSICSGDTIVKELALRYEPSHVIFLTSVDGLCSENPQIKKDAPLIKKLTKASFKAACTDQQIDIDVTGGIFQKCKIALELAENGIKTYIINGTKPGRFIAALSGDDVEGTVAE